VVTERLSESRRLRRKLELVLPGLESAAARLCRHPAVRDLYPRYLVMSHGIIRASVPLMAAARDRCGALDGDPVAAAVAAYTDSHIPEERGHDEWLLEDLATLGVDRATVVSRPPSATVAALVGAQYYWIHHVHPVALLGYVMLLEGYPPSTSTVDELRARTGYDAPAFRTLLAHADLDPHHGDELDAVVDALPLTPEQRTLLGVSALCSAALLTEALGELTAGAETAVVESAATAGGEAVLGRSR
jgi:Iron-containing redox enzyme